jgi:RNA polymerase sigma-70 factor (ECF subfamily)
MRESAQIVASGNPPEQEDRQLIAEVLRKDRKATAEFVDRCADYVYPFVRRRLLPRAEQVEDLMQEILLAAWQSLANFRGDATLRSWVLGIARHKVEDYYRKRIREAETGDNDDSALEAAVTPLFDEQLDAAMQHNRVQQTIALLPEPYALVLLWRYRDEKSVREMAELTGKTEKAIERLLARARWSFRKRWDDDKL